MRGVRIGVVFYVLLMMFLAASAGTLAGSKIVYHYNWYSDPVADKAALALIEEFQRLHPEYEVELVRGSFGPEGLMTAIVSGVSPDIVEFERSMVIEWAATGLLQPVDQFLDTPMEGTWLPGTLAEVYYEGAHYAVPSDTDIRGLYWHKEMLARGGFDADAGPATFSELEEMAHRLTILNADGTFSQFGFIPWLRPPHGNWGSVGWLYAWGGDIYDAVAKRPTINKEGHVRGFEWLQSFAQLYPPDLVAATLAGVNQSLLAGKTALTAFSTGLIPVLKNADPDFRFGVGEVPTPPGGQNGTWMGGMAHIIPAGAGNVEGAAVLLRWLASPEVQAVWARETVRLPTRLDAFELIQDDLLPEQAILVRQAGVAFGRPPLWYPPIYLTADEALDNVIYMRMGARPALEMAQRKLELIFAEVFGE